MASHLLEYMRRLGPLKGAGLYAAMKRKSGLHSVSLPTFAAPILLRGGTTDGRVLEDILLEREYDVPLAHPPRLIVDAGANVGYASVWFASRYPGARVVAVEPDDGNFEILQRNVAPYRGVECLKAAVWSRETVLAIENPEDEEWAFRVGEASAGVPGIAAVTILGLLERSGSPCIDVLKVDVEGAELQLFSDPECDRWLSRTRMIFIELHETFAPGCTAAFERAVARHPFRRSVSGEKTVLVQDIPSGR